MAEWLVEFYALENEESPVADWYAAQGSKVQAKLLWTFELLYEIRIRVERNNFRVIVIPIKNETISTAQI